MRYLILPLIFLLAACGGSKQSDTTADSTSVSQDSVLQIPAEDIPNTDSAIAEDRTMPPPPPPSKTKVVLCKLKTIEVGDCEHVIFDCGDFGNANINGLTPKELEAWKALYAFEEHGDFPIANPEKVGKTFEIKYEETEGDICEGAGVSRKGTIQKVLAFKQVSN